MTDSDSKSTLSLRCNKTPTLPLILHMALQLGADKNGTSKLITPSKLRAGSKPSSGAHNILPRREKASSSDHHPTEKTRRGGKAGKATLPVFVLPPPAFQARPC